MKKQYFELLMRKNNQTLYRVIKGYISDDTLAEDVMQEAYIIAYQKLNQFKGNSAFSTWLIRIGINEALRHIRNSKKEANMYINNETPDNYLSHEKVTPEIKIIQFEANNSIEKAIDELPSNLRSVFIMREIEGLNVNSVAEALGLSIENVKVRFHRAKKMLQESLMNYSDMEELYVYGSKHCDDMVNNVLNKIQNMPLPGH